MSDTQSLTPEQVVSMRIASLKEALDQKLPGMPLMLREIHKQLSALPECVTKLSEDEIAVIIKGAETISNTQLAVPTKATTKAAKQALKNVSLDDL